MYQKHRRIVFVLIVAALAVDTTFDFLALKQSFNSDQVNAAVLESYEVLGEIAEISLGQKELLEATLRRRPTQARASVTSIQTHLKTLRQKTAKNPIQAKALLPFDGLLSLPPGRAFETKLVNETRALSVALLDVRRDEQERLAVQLKEDDRVSKNARNQIFVASLLDFVLITGAGVLWYFFDRARRRNEKALEAASLSAQKTATELQRILEKKSRELRSTVHDLKNPLGSIKGFSDLIQEDCKDPASVSEMAMSLKRLSEHGLSLVSSLLEAETRSEGPNDHPRLANVVGYIDDVCLALKPQRLKKRQSLGYQHSGPPVEVFGDPKKLWDVFMNLIGNAIKFSPPDSSIQVRSFVHDRKFVVEIEDEGPGFTDQDKLNAFGEFQTLSARPSGDETSSGLGLHGAFHTVCEHNGSIEIADSQRGRGARLIVTLPCGGNSSVVAAPPLQEALGNDFFISPP